MWKGAPDYVEYEPRELADFEDHQVFELVKKGEWDLDTFKSFLLNREQWAWDSAKEGYKRPK